MSVLEDGSFNNAEGNEVTKEIKKELLQPDARGLSLGTVMGFSDEEMRATYAKACQKLAQNDLGGAGKLFALLIALRHNEAKHWRGMAVVAQRGSQHGVAEFMYTAALKHDPNDIISLVFRAEARVNLNRHGAARGDLARTIELGEASKNREDQIYVKRAKKLLQMLDAADTSGSFEH
jgi:predicted Zn-dependent protease